MGVEMDEGKKQPKIGHRGQKIFASNHQQFWMIMMNKKNNN
jgi:hypothetical protein